MVPETRMGAPWGRYWLHSNIKYGFWYVTCFLLHYAHIIKLAISLANLNGGFHSRLAGLTGTLVVQLCKHFVEVSFKPKCFPTRHIRMFFMSLLIISLHQLLCLPQWLNTCQKLRKEELFWLTLERFSPSQQRRHCGRGTRQQVPSEGLLKETVSCTSSSMWNPKRVKVMDGSRNQNGNYLEQAVTAWQHEVWLLACQVFSFTFPMYEWFSYMYDYVPHA